MPIEAMVSIPIEAIVAMPIEAVPLTVPCSSHGVGGSEAMRCLCGGVESVVSILEVLDVPAFSSLGGMNLANTTPLEVLDMSSVGGGIYFAIFTPPLVT